MRLIELIPTQYRLLVLGALLIALTSASAAAAWRVQDWRYGQQLERQARLQADDRMQLALAAGAQQRLEQEKRLALEQRLQASAQVHHRELTDAQNNQARLRDRLATADLRLSVQLDATDPANGCALPTAPGSGGVVHGASRARLDPAHAQRIIGITHDGDQGLIALAACQSYVKAVSTPQ